MPQPTSKSLEPWRMEQQKFLLADVLETAGTQPLGAATFEQFRDYCMNTGTFISPIDMKLMKTDPECIKTVERSLLEYFMTLDRDGNGLLTMDDADSRGIIHAHSEIPAASRRRKGKPYGDLLNHSAKRENHLVEKYSEEKLGLIYESEKRQRSMPSTAKALQKPKRKTR